MSLGWPLRSCSYRPYIYSLCQLAYVLIALIAAWQQPSTQATAAAMTTLCINRTIVEEDGHGFVRLSIAEKPIPSEADLQDDQVHSPSSCSPQPPSYAARSTTPAPGARRCGRALGTHSS
jgi:hypothetical protein